MHARVHLVFELPGFSTLLSPSISENDAACTAAASHASRPADGARRLGAGHVVGHSSVQLVALRDGDRQLSSRVGTLSLLEPAIRGIPSSAAVLRALVPVVTTYELGDTAGAVDAFLRLVCGDRYRAVLDRMIPNAFSEALAYADLFFQTEMPAIAEWSFGPADAARVTRPVLNVLGGESAQRFVEGSELLQSWFPKAEQLSVPAAGHLLMVQNPTAVADGLMGYFARHPIANAG